MFGLLPCLGMENDDPKGDRHGAPPGCRRGGRELSGYASWGKTIEIARVIRPVPQGRESERASDRGRLRRRLDPSEGISESHAPPSLHVDLHLTRILRRWAG